MIFFGEQPGTRVPDHALKCSICQRFASQPNPLSAATTIPGAGFPHLHNKKLDDARLTMAGIFRPADRTASTRLPRTTFRKFRLFTEVSPEIGGRGPTQISHPLPKQQQDQDPVYEGAGNDQQQQRRSRPGRRASARNRSWRIARWPKARRRSRTPAAANLASDVIQARSSSRYLPNREEQHQQQIDPGPDGRWRAQAICASRAHQRDLQRHVDGNAGSAPP